MSDDSARISALLKDAEEILVGDRMNDYGTPTETFERISSLWSAYIGIPIAAHEVAMMMILLKMARLGATAEKRDSWLDIAGYAACGWAVVEKNS